MNFFAKIPIRFIMRVSAKFTQSLNHFHLLKQQAGQAIVEYVLLLVVVVGIVLGAMYQFSDAFQQYVAGYFGDYLACLLETGEMPSLGVQDGSGVCNSQFEPFSLANGRSPSDFATGGAGGSASGTASDNSSSSAQDAAQRNANAARNNPQNSQSDAASRARRRANRRKSPRNAESGSGTENGSKIALTSSKKGKKKRVRRRRKRGFFVEDDEPLSARRLRSQAKKKVQVNRKKRKSEKSLKKIKARNTNQSRPKKLRFDPNKLRLPASKGDEGWGLSVSDYLRYMVILGLIMMVVIFLMGQFAAIRKSWEKGE